MGLWALLLDHFSNWISVISPLLHADAVRCIIISLVCMTCGFTVDDDDRRRLFQTENWLSLGNKI
jgi:hypothetical protein